MPSEWESGWARHEHWEQNGTISSDGIGSFGNSFDDIAGFTSLYPVPAFSPVLDVFGHRGASHATEGLPTTQSAAGGGTIQGASDTSSDSLISSGTPLTIETAGGSTSGLDIIANFDSSITTLAASVSNEIETAISAAISFYETTFSNSITFTIDFGYGTIDGQAMSSTSLSESSDNGVTLKHNNTLNAYPTLQAALQAHDSALGASAIPTIDPFHSSTDFWFVPDAEAEALGISETGSVAGYIGLADSSSFPLNFSTTDRAVSGEYDVVGAMEHEISEVMGRVAGYSGSVYNPLDLFRYTSPGTLANSGTAAYFSINDGTTNLAWFNNFNANGGDAGDWNSSTTIIGGVTMAPVTNDSYDAFSSMGVANTVSAVDITEMQMLGYTAVCFAAGTRIATPSGEVPVEQLSTGDAVLTLSGVTRPILWIGVGRVLATRGARGPGSPVIVRRGALADNVPKRDLQVTKGHALYLDGALIPVEELVNGRSIVWDDRARELAIYHVELDTHDVLIADGAPAETYRDDGNRWLFRNVNPAWHLPPQAPCAPLITNGAAVDAIWRRLLERAGGGAALTDEPDLHLLVDGRRVDAIERNAGRYVFPLDAMPRSVRLCSRSAVPQDLGLARDPRLLGVAVRQFVLGQPWRAWTAAASVLADGYHEYEPSDDIRWTTGNAAIPASLFAGISEPGVLIVDLGPTTRYLDDAGQDAGQPGLKAA